MSRNTHFFGAEKSIRKSNSCCPLVQVLMAKENNNGTTKIDLHKIKKQPHSEEMGLFFNRTEQHSGRYLNKKLVIFLREPL